jgi:hypothetical protein
LLADDLVVHINDVEDFFTHLLCGCRTKFCR